MHLAVHPLLQALLDLPLHQPNAAPVSEQHQQYEHGDPENQLVHRVPFPSEANRSVRSDEQK